MAMSLRVVHPQALADLEREARKLLEEKCNLQVASNKMVFIDNRILEYPVGGAYYEVRYSYVANEPLAGIRYKVEIDLARYGGFDRLWAIYIKAGYAADYDYVGGGTLRN